MADDSDEINKTAAKLGELVAAHSAVAKYKQAQKAVTEDPEASRLLAEFDRSIEILSRQEAAGAPISEAQQQQLQAIQARITSHIKVKALNLAQVDFVDLLRKVSQTWQKPLQDATGSKGGTGSRSPLVSGA